MYNTLGTHLKIRFRVNEINAETRFVFCAVVQMNETNAAVASLTVH